MLAVLKLGAAFVLLDSGLPVSRLQNMVEQVNAAIVLCSGSSVQLAEKLASTVVKVPVVTTEDNASSTEFCVPANIDPLLTIAAIVFTSGTTGTPKGVLVSHANLASTFKYTATTVGLNERTRMLDSASYGFDAAIYQSLGTLCNGGCVCVPSDSERLTAMASAIRRFNVNTAILTPSVARLLEPESVPSLQRLKLVGESASLTLIEKWLSHNVKIVLGYGPSECAVCSNVGIFQRDVTAVNNIGHTLGCLAWIVDLDDHEKLLPVGATGELLLEGPNVGAGYLKDRERTSAAFIKAPKWLQRGFDAVAGRNSTLYKTGDLVQYHRDGSILYIGRKDQQKKLRGQRIDLKEIEYAIAQASAEKLDVIAEICTNALSENELQLVAFCCLRSFENTIKNIPQQSKTDTESLILPASREFMTIAEQIRKKLQSEVPSYMIPSIILPVSEIPRTKPSDKLDRKRMIREVRKVDQSHLRSYFPVTSKALSTAKELKLQQLLKQVLRSDLNISADDHLFSLGGTSITAIELIAAARQSGFFLQMQDVLYHDNIAALASKMSALDDTKDMSTSLPPFSLIAEKLRTEVFREASLRYGIYSTSIEDILPCTPMQEGLMALGEQRYGGHIAQQIFDLPPETDLKCLKSSWETVSLQNSIMRTCIIDTPARLLQVVTREPLLIPEYENVELGFVTRTLISQIRLGSPLVNLAIISQSRGKSSCSQLIWTAHHAACDGWQVPRIFDQVELAYRGTKLPPQCEFNLFVKYIVDGDRERHSAYWTRQLAGPIPATYPIHHEGEGWATESKRIQVHLGDSAPHRHLLATKINLAWSLLVAAYAESSDIVFGLTLTGRNAPIPGIADMTGPTITTVPFRQQVDFSLTVGEALDRVQKQLIEMIPYEQTGLQNIRQLSDEAAAACDLQSLLVIQPSIETQSEGRYKVLIPAQKYKESRLAFSNYPLTMECTICSNENLVNVSAQFNDRIISSDQMTHILHQFGHALRQIHAHPDMKLSTVNLLSPYDIERLIAWNGTCQTAVNQTLNELIERRTDQDPNAPAVDAWDGNWTYQELNTLSSQFAFFLQQLGIHSDEVVPVCSEKSRLTPVIILALLKIGAGCTLVDARLPQGRVNQILSNSRARYFICSEMYQYHFDVADTSAKKIVASVPWIQELRPVLVDVQWNNNPDTIAFVVYTSGSTGRPKGVVLEHRALSTSIFAHGSVLGIGPSSRMLQFASCSFDINLYENMTTLVLGGCICIPSEDARLNKPAQYARESGATVTLSAPTIMQALGQEEIPELKTISLGGEPITAEVVDTWKDQAQVFNGYGPAECTICAMHPVEKNTKGEGQANPLATIGRGLGCTFWAVDIVDPSRLAPVGVVGELYIEGPVLARGYLNDFERTMSSFLSSPSWLNRFREGDTSQSRVYRTGDLVRYNTDGTVVFVGRRDTQTKLRGQRIELSEVEYYLHKAFFESPKVVVDVATLLGKNQLIGFVEEKTDQGSLCKDCNRVDPSTSEQKQSEQFVFKSLSEYQAENAEATRMLFQALPSYMVPSLILHITAIPKTLTGKTDRKALREAASNLSAEEISLAMQGETQHRSPSTEAETKLRDLWSDILRLPKDCIGADDSFFARGGDSITAMRLVSSARALGLHLTVRDVINSPKLSSLAQIACPDILNGLHDQTRERKTRQVWEPFHALECEIGSRQNFIQDIIRPFDIPDSNVSDVLPATSLQEFALSNCPTFFIFNIGDRLDLDLAVSSWLRIIAEHDILRTLFISHNDKHYQVILRDLSRIEQSFHTITENTDEAVDTLLREKEAASVSLPVGNSPLKFIIITSPETRYLVLRMSHAQYDGFSISELWSDWRSAFDGLPLHPRCSYADFVYSARALGENGGYDFYKVVLKDSTMTYLTPLPTAEALGDDKANENSGVHEVETVVENIHGLPNVTMATFVQAVWIMTLVRWSKKDDIVFGLVTTGRRSKRHDFDTVMGPCLEIMPIRAKLRPGWSLYDLCEHLQRQDADSMEFEGMELFKIIKECTNWDPAAPLGTWLQHDNTDWNAELVLGGMNYGGPRVYDTPYGQDDVGIETLYLGDGTLKIKLSSPAHILNASMLHDLQILTCETLKIFAEKPETNLADYYCQQTALF
ncbi:uncharacterized protein BHQ10_001067 [Talaromyces amestolkiae]|uniref:Carrier domain-containing protein n=1 Tax=Talaromyces amestolkiae TaxID=1196081 RepID=A0A364KNE8_TALAM|nr:uncharacterized protein BHQ10_001067 [Talaromyces amestolkiae]RAO65055.1 hypothetical protein BHQ10_001067 [Talaromyces amestolkiae]